MTIRAVVFDIGGVLETTIDTEMTEKWEMRLNLQSGELNKRMGSAGWRDAAVGRLSEEDMFQNLGEITGMDQEQVDEFTHDFWEEYLGALNGELAHYFTSLRSCYQTAILSDGYPGARRREQERYHFEEMTDLIMYSYEVGTTKRDKRSFEMTCERLGVQPEEIVFLDDVDWIVAGACQFGIHAILFQETAQAIADVQACLQASAHELQRGC